MTINILETWGDNFYVGLTGITIFGIVFNTIIKKILIIFWDIYSITTKINLIIKKIIKIKKLNWL